MLGLQDNLYDLEKKMKKLKAILYAKFGNTINLEEEWVRKSTILNFKIKLNFLNVILKKIVIYNSISFMYSKFIHFINFQMDNA